MGAAEESAIRSPPGLIALDWGTSALRGWLISPAGAVLERRADARGIMAIKDGGFDAVFREFTAAWRAACPGLPALASGMIGSRQGWLEAPYAPCPAGFGDLVERCVLAGMPDAALRIVPGLSWCAPDGMVDVMRGEETQIFGALGDTASDGLFILPGTHSKWVAVDAGRVVAFSTWMTGELFAVLRGHSILGRLMPADGVTPADEGAFGAGVAEGIDGGRELTHRLFGVRTRGLFGTLAPTAAPEFLSGLLIGAEIGGARARGGVGAGAGTAILIGEVTLCDRYAKALAMAGVTARTAHPDVTPRGLWRLARAAGMIGG